MVDVNTKVMEVELDEELPAMVGKCVSGKTAKPKAKPDKAPAALTSFNANLESGYLERLVSITEDGPARWVPVCDLIHVRFQLLDDQGGTHYVVEYTDAFGKTREAILSAEEVTDPRSLETKVAKLGIGRGPEIKHLPAYFRLLTFHRKLPIASLTDRVGWVDGKHYALPSGVIAAEGETAERIYFSGQQDHGISTSGTLEEWKRLVAAPCEENSRPNFLISLALAVPMFKALDLDGGGVNILGRSSTGKTTALYPAISVCGSRRYMGTWEATRVGLEQSALAHNDLPMFLDEQGLADAKHLGNNLYSLASGTERLRGRSGKHTGSVSLAAPKRWRTLVISTSEKDLSEKMREAGLSPLAGQEVRLLDIPAVPAGFDQVFETAAGHSSTAALAAHLHRHSSHHYGHALVAMVQALCGLSLDQQEEMYAKTTAWKEANIPAGSDGQVIRAASIFAAASVAGELAIALGILPWAAGRADWAAKICFQDWLRQRGGHGSQERRRGLQAVLNYLDLYLPSRFMDASVTSATAPQKLSGYVRRTKDQDPSSSERAPQDILFTVPGLKEAVGAGNIEETLAELKALGIIESVSNKSTKLHGRSVRVWTFSGEALERYHGASPAVPQPTLDDFDDEAC